MPCLQAARPGREARTLIIKDESLHEEIAFFHRPRKRGLGVGKSFTSLGRYGFWTRDALLELWLDLMADEIDRNDAPEHWLHDVARRWHFAARVGFGGCVPAGLDEAASDEERRGRLRDVAVAARQRVAEDPGLLRVDELNRRNLGGDGCFFASDMEPDMVMQVADAFIALLEVRLETTARDRVVVGTRPPK